MQFWGLSPLTKITNPLASVNRLVQNDPWLLASSLLGGGGGVGGRGSPIFRQNALHLVLEHLGPVAPLHTTNCLQLFGFQYLNMQGRLAEFPPKLVLRRARCASTKIKARRLSTGNGSWKPRDVTKTRNAVSSSRGTITNNTTVVHSTGVSLPRQQKQQSSCTFRPWCSLLFAFRLHTAYTSHKIPNVRITCKPQEL